MSTATETTWDTELFESIVLEEFVACSMQECDSEATNLLKCGMCDAAETICAFHTHQIAIAQVVQPTSTITFENTCNHSPRIGDCTIVPLG